MLKRTATALALWAALAGWGFAQTPAGAEFQVNSHTTGLQWLPDVSVERDGDFVIGWTGVGATGVLQDVWAQRYAAGGPAIGTNFLVNTYTPGFQGVNSKVSVASDFKGNFVVVWPSYGQDGSGWGVFGQRYTAAGAKAGAEFRVNTYTTGNQGAFLFQVNQVGSPEVAMAYNGRFVVVWDSAGQDGSVSSVHGQRYDAAGAPLGGEFRVNTTTVGGQFQPEVAIDIFGRFVVAWTSPDGGGYGVFAQRYDAAGTPQGGEFRVNSFTTGQQSYPVLSKPALAFAANGNFIVAWTSEGGQDGSGSGIYAQRYAPTGAPIGGEFVVNQTTLGDQYWPSVGSDDIGNFVVTWSGPVNGSFEVQGRRFTPAATTRGPEFIVNSYTTGGQYAATVGSDPVGNFVVTWTRTSDGSGQGVFARRFGGIQPATLELDLVAGNSNGNRVLDPGETVTMTPGWRNVHGAALSFGGHLSNFTGPAGANYNIPDSNADYGAVANNAIGTCASDCYAVSVSNPPTRPAQHWDTNIDESLTPDSLGPAKRWLLHVGGSFTDVSPTSPFQRFVETMLHRSITGGCTGTEYCPSSASTREQMAVFVLVAKEGGGYSPPACTTPVFADVPASSPFCKWIEELFRRGVVGGCGGGNYCPSSAVTREQMSVFVLRTLDPALNPPACTTPMFGDVPASSAFCRWIEELARRGVVGGCGGGNFCPSDSVTREQMAVFISGTFGLTLYGP